MLELTINPASTWTAEFQRKIDINTAVTISFLVELDRMLTEKQRSHLLDRIESLAGDLDTLSCDPRTRPKPDFDLKGGPTPPGDTSKN